MIELYQDILNLILDKLDFLSQIRFRQVNKYFYHNLHITDFYGIDEISKKILNDDILKNYPHIKYLNVENNTKIKKINHFKNLKILNCAGQRTSVSDEDLIGLDLYQLNVFGNSKIKNISHLKNLKILCCGGCYYNYHGIDNDSMKDLDLIELNINFHFDITKINHFKNLKKLSCCTSAINDLHMIGLDLIELNSADNSKIKKVNQFKNLKILNCRGFSGVTDSDLIGLDLIELMARNNNKIKKINHLKNLKYLDCSGKDCKIANDDIQDLNLIELNTYKNPNITKISHFKNLKILICEINSPIKDLDGLNLSIFYGDKIDGPNFKYFKDLRNIKVFYSITRNTMIYKIVDTKV